jgi:hypothetical protein
MTLSPFLGSFAAGLAVGAGAGRVLRASGEERVVAAPATSLEHHEEPHFYEAKRRTLWDALSMRENAHEGLTDDELFRVRAREALREAVRLRGADGPAVRITRFRDSDSRAVRFTNDVLFGARDAVRLGTSNEETYIVVPSEFVAHESDCDRRTHAMPSNLASNMGVDANGRFQRFLEERNVAAK